MSKTKEIRVALVHDWLVRTGGAERTLECFCELFPNADIFTLFHKPGSVSRTIESHKITTSFLQRFPEWARYYRYLLPLMPVAIEQFDLSEYDLVISGSACVAKGAITPVSALHVSYIYAPMRYIWDKYNEYFREKTLLERAIIAPCANYLRVWDVAASDRADVVVADSKYISNAIEKQYRRKPDAIIYPPVDVDKFSLNNRKREDYFLMVTTFEPYKRVELAVEAFSGLSYRLKIVANSGRDRSSISEKLPSNIEILDSVTDKELVGLYQNARALIVSGVEDFGISPLEAMACGTPVIAYADGGALETVIPANPKSGEISDQAPTGMLFYQPTGHSLRDAVEYFVKYDRQEGWDRQALRKHAEGFSKRSFMDNFRNLVDEKLV